MRMTLITPLIRPRPLRRRSPDAALRLCRAVCLLASPIVVAGSAAAWLGGLDSWAGLVSAAAAALALVLIIAAVAAAGRVA